MVIREIAETERDAYNRLVPHITQSWEWGSFRTRTQSVAKVSRLGVFEGPKLVRGYQLFFHLVPYFNRLIAYLPRSYYPSPDDLKALLAACQKDRAVYLKLEPQETENTASLPAAVPGRNILPAHSFLLNISGSEEEILSRMHEKTRYNIRLAEKKGVVIAQKDDSHSLEQFIRLHEQTQERQGFYAKSGNYLRLLWETLYPAKMVYLLCAYPPGRDDPIAALMLFRFGPTLYYPYGGWSAEGREFMPNNLLHFEAIKLGKKLGCTAYDLWSSYQSSPKSSDPWYGTYIFKKGFGAAEVNYVGALDIPLDRPIYQAMQLADSLRWKYLKIKRTVGL